MTAAPDTAARLAQIRALIIGERMSLSDVLDLQTIGKENPAALADDILLREWAGLPE